MLLVHGRGREREAVGDLELGGDIGTDEETSGRSRECACRVLDDAHDHEGLDLNLAQRRGGVLNGGHGGYDQVCRFGLSGGVSGYRGGSRAEAAVWLLVPVFVAAPRRC